MSWRQKRRRSARLSGRRGGSARLPRPEDLRSSGEHEGARDKSDSRSRSRERGSGRQRRDSARQRGSGSGSGRYRSDSTRLRSSGELGSARRRALSDSSDGSATRERDVPPFLVIGPLRMTGLQCLKASLVVCAVALVFMLSGLLSSEKRRRQTAGNNAERSGRRDPSIGLGGRDGRDSGRRRSAGSAGGQAGAGSHRLRALDGQVVDQDGRAIRDASVVLTKPKMELGRTTFDALEPPVPTDANGQFTLLTERHGSLLKVTAKGFAGRLVPLPADRTAHRGLSIVLLPSRAAFGLVTAAEDGRPLEGARVVGESASWRGEVTSDADGRFRFEDLPPEQASLLVTASGRVPVVMDVPRGLEDELTVPLMAGRAVRGRIVDRLGNPVAGAEVLVFGSEHPAVPSLTRSDSTGRFAVRGPGPNDDVLVVARTETHATGLREPWHGVDETDITVTLLAAGALTLQTVRPEEVRLLPVLTQPGFDAPEPATVPEGLRYTGLSPGSWQIERRGRIVGDAFTIAPGEDIRLPVDDMRADEGMITEGAEVAETPTEVEDGAPIEVTVTDGDGRGLSGATVTADDLLHGNGPRSFQADETGRLTLPRRSTRTLLTASMPGRILAQSLEVGAEQHEARLVLVVPVGLEGRLEPAASGHLMLVDPELGETIRRTPIGRDGRFRLDGITPGRYVLEVEAQGFAPSVVAVSLPVPGDRVTIEMVPGGECHHLPDDIRDAPADTHKH